MHHLLLYFKSINLASLSTGNWEQSEVRGCCLIYLTVERPGFLNLEVMSLYPLELWSFQVLFLDRVHMFHLKNFWASLLLLLYICEIVWNLLVSEFKIDGYPCKKVDWQLNFYFSVFLGCLWRDEYFRPLLIFFFNLDTFYLFFYLASHPSPQVGLGR